MTYCFPIFAFCLLSLSANAQGFNLVPNGGFEERSACPPTNSAIENAPPWYNPNKLPSQVVAEATPDIFHQCVVVNSEPCPYPENFILDPWLFGVPTNSWGCQEPFEGVGYAGAYFFTPGIPPLFEYREYLAVGLIEPLQAGVEYQVTFLVSLAERMSKAIWNFQVLFSPDSLQQPAIGYMNQVPQLNGQNGQYVTNKDGWTLLSWNYIADGTEKHLCIGNFQSNADIDTVNVVEGSNLFFFNAAYYYIDQVSISSTVNGLFLSNGSEQISVFPNPTSQLLNFRINDYSFERIDIIDLLGRTYPINSWNFNNGNIAIDVSNFSSGVYLINIVDNHRNVRNAKFVKQ